MIQEDDEGRWERLDAKVQSKWGKRTRLERNLAAGNRHAPLGKPDEVSEIAGEGAPAPEKLRPWRP